MRVVLGASCRIRIRTSFGCWAYQQRRDHLCICRLNKQAIVRRLCASCAHVAMSGAYTGMVGLSVNLWDIRALQLLPNCSRTLSRGNRVEKKCKNRGCKPARCWHETKRSERQEQRRQTRSTEIWAYPHGHGQISRRVQVLTA